MPRDGFYFDTIGYGGWNPDFRPPPMESVRKASQSWVMKDETLRYLEDRARTRRQSTDKALVLGAWGAGGMHYVGKLTEFLCLLATDRPYVRELFALGTEKGIENLRLLKDAVGENVDVIALCGLDFGSQRSEIFSRETFCEVYLPAYRKLFAWIHQNTRWKIFKHCDGSIPKLMGDLVEAGLDALNPVQTSATGMDPRWLKATFGQRLTFWGGGVETQSTLPFGTPDQVRAEVAERVRLFAPGGGFVFCPIHNIQPNTPPENILAAYETARSVGRLR
jgi:uroporphyrinogen-III decarboxylase